MSFVARDVPCSNAILSVLQKARITTITPLTSAMLLKLEEVGDVFKINGKELGMVSHLLKIQHVQQVSNSIICVPHWGSPGPILKSSLTSGFLPACKCPSLGR